MMKKQMLVLALLLGTLMSFAQNDRITISGKVTDFEGNLKANALVQLMHSDFADIPELITHTDSLGNYSLCVPKGTYYTMASIIMDEYRNANPDLALEKQRLEFWGWNIIAENDLHIDIHYDRMEVYAVNIFKVQGSALGAYQIFCRPMILSKIQDNVKKGLGQQDMNTLPENLEVNVSINGEKAKVIMKQRVKEMISDNDFQYAYLFTVVPAKRQKAKLVDRFHIHLKDNVSGDQGEAVSFYRNK